MATLKWPTKDPDAILDYAIDWTLFLGTDTIVTSIWILPADLVKQSDAHNTVSTLIWLSGGIAGQTYSVTNRITTALGRTDDRTVKITVKDK